MTPEAIEIAALIETLKWSAGVIGVLLLGIAGIVNGRISNLERGIGQLMGEGVITVKSHGESMSRLHEKLNALTIEIERLKMREGVEG